MGTLVHSCSIIVKQFSARVPFVCTLVQSCSLVFHSCLLVFTRVPFVFTRVHLCSLVFTSVHSCSDSCGVLDQIVEDKSVASCQ